MPIVELMSVMAILAWPVAPIGISSSASSTPPTGHQTALALGSLDNPRGIALGQDGAVVIADAGTPIDPSSGRVVRVDRDGAVTSLLENVANMVGTDGEFGQAHLHGLSDVAVHDGVLYVVLGQEAWVGSPLFGPNRLVRREPTGDVVPLFDIGIFEQDRDPDGDGAESNANGVAVAPDGTVWVDDAAGNWVARLEASGEVAAVAAFPDVDGEDAVPTGITVGPDGNAYVALFRCRSPTAGKGGVVRVKPDGSVEPVASGFSNPIDVAFDAAGEMYVLEFSIDYAPKSGRLLRVSGRDSSEVVLDGLHNPTSLVIDGLGGIYITSMADPAGGQAGTGKLLYIAPGN